MQPPEPVPHETLLLENDAWLRTLIRQLVRADRVDDVAQDTWVAALNTEAGQPRSARAWLAAVARRLAFRSHRSEARRLQRERKVAKPEPSAGADEVVQHIELRQRVTSAVLALEEPFRTTVLQRFYEGRTPQQIAVRLGVPAATVRSRLHRAVGMLRVALDVRDERQRRSLLAAAVSLPRSAPWKVMLMSPKLKLSAVAAAFVVLVSAAALWWSSQGAPETPTSSDTAASRVASEPQPEPPAGSQAASRTALPPAPVFAATTGARPAVQRLAGHVLDLEGFPVAGAEIYQRPDLGEPLFADPQADVPADWIDLGTSGPDGSFEVELESTAGWLVVGPPLIAVRPWTCSASAEDAVIVAAPAVTLVGLVTDRNGTPLPGVSMSAFCERLPGFPTPLHRNGRPSFPGGVTDTHGRFSLARVPAAPAVAVTFQLAGYREHRLPGPTTMGEYLHVVLEPLAGDEGREIIGRVFDPDRVPVAGASVHLGEIRAVTDALGAYRIEVPAAVTDDVLFARAGDDLPAIADIAKVLQGPAPHVHDFHLRAATGVISGRIVGPDGEPWHGVVVYPWDVEYFGSTQVTTEGFEVGAEDEWIGNSVTTDRDGRFQLTGLAERTYRLRFLDHGMPFGYTSDPIAAGSNGLVIRVPSDALRETLRGRVIDARGRGVAEVAVEFMVPIRMRDGNGVSTGGGGVLTDRDGSFTLRNAPRESGNLIVRSEHIVPTRHFVADSAPDSGLEITVHRRCWFRVQALQAPAGSVFDVLNAAGQALDVIQFTGGGRITQRSWPLTDGRTEVLAVSEAAHVIVLRHQGQELARQRLSLQTDGTTEVRF